MELSLVYDLQPESWFQCLNAKPRRARCEDCKGVLFQALLSSWQHALYLCSVCSLPRQSRRLHAMHQLFPKGLVIDLALAFV